MSQRKISQELLEESAHEAEYFDKFYTELDEDHGQQDYLVPEYLINQVIEPRNPNLDAHEYAYSLLGDLDGRSLLDYGAGDGWNTVMFAKAKAKVWAIDISENGINLIKKKAIANGVEDSVIAEVQNAYKMKYPADMFDIVYGGGILHHLDIEEMGQEINRIIRPGGVAVFYEPIRETKIMDVIKSIVLRILGRAAEDMTEDEEPLTSKRIKLLKVYFDVVNYRYFEVISSANLLIKSDFLKRVLLRIDHVLIRYFPGYKLLGRVVVIELRKPIKLSNL